MKSETHFTVAATCRGCGACVDACAMQILSVAGQGDRRVIAIADRTRACMRCGQCMAICPTSSIQVEGLEYGRDLTGLPVDDVDAERFSRFAATRRSVRAFSDRPVERADLEAIVEAITQAPMGYTPHKVAVTVLPERIHVERTLSAIREGYERLARQLERPIPRFFIRRALSPDGWTALTEHVMPSMRWRLPEMKDGGRDTITRGAPALLLFHARREAGNASEDAIVAATYAALAAHARGLGACIIGLVAPMVERTPALRALLRIPDDHAVLTAIGVGHSRLHFRRAIRRQLPSVTWL